MDIDQNNKNREKPRWNLLLGLFSIKPQQLSIWSCSPFSPDGHNEVKMSFDFQVQFERGLEAVVARGIALRSFIQLEGSLQKHV